MVLKGMTLLRSKYDIECSYIKVKFKNTQARKNSQRLFPNLRPKMEYGKRNDINNNNIIDNNILKYEKFKTPYGKEIALIILI